MLVNRYSVSFKIGPYPPKYNSSSIFIRICFTTMNNKSSWDYALILYLNLIIF